MKSRIAAIFVLLPVLSIPSFSSSSERSDKAARIDAQSSLRAVISLDLKNVPLEEAIAVIARKGKLKLNYNRTRIPVDRSVTLFLEKVTAGEALLRILKDSGTELKITPSGHLVIVPVKPAVQGPSESRTGMIRGLVCDDRSGFPLPATLVVLPGFGATTLTDSEGIFRFTDLPPGTYSAVLTYLGYETATIPGIEVRRDRVTDTKSRMEWKPIEVESATIDVFARIKSRSNSPSVHTLTSREIQGAPGSGGVISRMPSTLPGLSFVTDENLDFVVRGGSPLENGFYIDNIEVPGIGHISRSGSQGGFYSSFDPGLIRNMEFISGCFSPDFGDRLSPITRITMREGNRDGLAGKTDISLAGVGAQLEGPVFGRRGAWIVSFRKSYLGAMKNMATELATVPNTLDSQMKLSIDLSPRHKLSLLNIYGNGRYDQAAPTVWRSAEMRQIQNTAGMDWVSNWSRNMFSSTSLSYSICRRSDGESEHLNQLSPGLWSLTERASFVNLRNSNFLVLDKNHKLDFGFQVKHERERLNHVISTPMVNNYGSLVTDSRLDMAYRTTKLSLFASYIVSPLRPFTLNLGLRSDYSSAHRHLSVSPRLSLGVNLSHRLTLNAGMGIVRQTLPMNILAYVPEAVGLDPMKATHYSLGLEYSSEPGTRLSLEVYAKEYRNLAFSQDAPLNLLTDLWLDRSIESDGAVIGYWLPTQVVGSGTAYCRGIEFMYQKNWHPSLFTIVTASFFRSRFTDLAGETRNRIHDIRYILNLMAKYKPTPDWELSAGWIFMGGAPYTPLDIYRSSQAQSWILDDSRYLAGRFPAYNCLNLRISRERFLNNNNVYIYLDILNVLNRDNVSSYDLDSWNLSPDADHQLGILPVLGIMYRF